MYDLFSRIAESNPDAANAICYSNGYECHTIEQVAEALRELCANSGNNMQAFQDIVNLHPDREIIIDLYSQSAKGCSDCKAANLNKMLVQTNAQSADGTSSTAAPASSGIGKISDNFLKSVTDTNKMLVTGLVIVSAVAFILIINKNNNN